MVIMKRNAPTYAAVVVDFHERRTRLVRRPVRLTNCLCNCFAPLGAEIDVRIIVLLARYYYKALPLCFRLAKDNIDPFITNIRQKCSLSYKSTALVGSLL